MKIEKHFRLLFYALLKFILPLFHPYWSEVLFLTQKLWWEGTFFFLFFCQILENYEASRTLENFIDISGTFLLFSFLGRPRELADYEPTKSERWGESVFVSVFIFDLLIPLPRYDAPELAIALEIAIRAFVYYTSVFRTTFYVVLLFLS